MSRQLRIPVRSALYHVTARGSRLDAIYHSDADRLVWLSLLGETCARYNFSIRAYCQMTNHYHILLETVDGELARGMCYLNGKYSRYFNRAHGLVGHVFQGRYKAILCQREAYLLELSRYIELNPVRANMVPRPDLWPWSSHRAMLGMADSPRWLQADVLLGYFGSQLTESRRGYQEFVAAGIGKASPLARIKNQLILGDEGFCAGIAPHQQQVACPEFNRTQRRAVAQPLANYFHEYRDPKEAMAQAYRSLAYSMQEIARYARVSVKTVSRAIQAFEGKDDVS